ncbi:unnamed protein product [Sphagnum compactum]
MDRKKQSVSKDKKLKKKEELAKKKAIDETVRTAAAKAAPIEEFPSFLKYERNGLNLQLEAELGEKLSPPLKQYIQDLLKLNMEGPFGPDEWPAEEKKKRRDMVSPDARYIIVREKNLSQDSKFSSDSNLGLSDHHHCAGLWGANGGDPVVAFVHYRFVVEHDVPVLYVFEIQLEQSVQGKGFGKFLMQFLELIARKNNMKAVLLTVQKRNTRAMAFYTQKLRFVVASISPSRWQDTLTGAEMTYEILCKTFDVEAKAILEEGTPLGAET